MSDNKQCPDSPNTRHVYRHVEDRIISCRFCGKTRTTKNDDFLARVKERDEDWENHPLSENS